jgi:hypothetical protein
MSLCLSVSMDSIVYEEGFVGGVFQFEMIMLAPFISILFDWP